MPAEAARNSAAVAAIPAGGSITVRTPASSANLGPGFDSLGLALGMYDEVTLTPSDTPSVTVTGEGQGEVPDDDSHLVVASMAHALRALQLPVPAVELQCRNAIPHARGLGSSASAIVAGVLLAELVAADACGTVDKECELELLNARVDRQRLVAVAAALEGHPDNVAACALGGFTVAWRESRSGSGEGCGAAGNATSGLSRAVGLRPHPGLRTIAYIPQRACSTSAARGLLPETVPHADAAFTASRAALLVHAITDDPSRLYPATEDRLHQDYRASAMTESHALVQQLRAEGFAAVISGAGGTVLCLLSDDHEPGEADGFRRCPLPIDTSGARRIG